MAKGLINIDAGKILDKVLSKDSILADLFKGKERKLAELKIELQKELNEMNTQRIELNKIEASNPNVFVSGWRPSVGWCCSFALAYNFIIQPLLTWIAQLCGATVNAPNLDITELTSILIALLGFGGFRTYEKIKNNTKNNIENV